MPRLSCWFVRAALVHLCIGVVLGALILSAKGMPALFGWSWLLLPAHIQVLIGGWMVQFALGVAYWILPRLDGTGERGRAGWAHASFWTLNSSVTGAALLLTLRSLYWTPWLGGLLALAALLQVAALAAFAYHAWPRLRPLEIGGASGTATLRQPNS